MIVNRDAHHHHSDRVSAAIVAGLRIITDETLVYSCVRGRRHAATLSRPVVTTPPSLMTEFFPPPPGITLPPEITIVDICPWLALGF